MNTQMRLFLFLIFFLVGCNQGERLESQESRARPKAVARRGSVNLKTEYDLSNLSIPEDQIHRLLPRDAIPALTDPKRESVKEATTWLNPDARVIAVKIGGDVLGVPLQILNYHEIANVTVGGKPIAVTYCPLCDSATVFSRLLKPSGDKGNAAVDEQGNSSEAITLEFGVSGALFNSNVLMYDTTERGLWSQLGMEAVSGPRQGTRLEMLPIELITFRAFAAAFPTAELISHQTGHIRNYQQTPYTQYFSNNDLMVPVWNYKNDLPEKTLGVGIATDQNAWFVPQQNLDIVREIQTDLGLVKLARSEAGIQVVEAPAGVRTAQTFYYSWTAFYPESKLVTRKQD